MLDAETDRVCGVGANNRDGYCERSLATCVSTLTPRIPKLRSDSFFPEDVIERCQFVGCALVPAVVEMYAAGTSTRKAQRVAEKMGVSRLSMEQVCAIASCLNADIEERSDDMATLLLSNYSMRCLKRALQDNLALVVRGTSLVPGF